MEDILHFISLKEKAIRCDYTECDGGMSMNLEFFLLKNVSPVFMEIFMFFN
jgi:hypothetical protein